MTSPFDHRYPIRRRLSLAVVAAALALFTMVALAGPARAAETANWDGIDPRGTPCNEDAATVASADIEFEGHRLGAVELRYSDNCRTAWARLINDMDRETADAHTGVGKVIRDSDGLTFQCVSPPGDGTNCFTAMVNDAGVTLHAYGDIDPHPTYGNGSAEARTKSY
ncbi:MAG: DUF2690 domain-containing protein [Stackebrandtia sp.]